MTRKKLQLHMPQDLYERIKKYGDRKFCKDTEAARQLIVLGLEHEADPAQAGAAHKPSPSDHRDR